jgi:hypothetical protein
LLPPKQPGELRIDKFVRASDARAGARNLLNFVRVPEDFVRTLKTKSHPLYVLKTSSGLIW